MTSVPSLGGRRFMPVAVGGDGEVGDGTVFEYHQDGDLVWACYSGGRIRLGYLVGTRVGDGLLFRYTHVSVDGATATGRCETRLAWTARGASCSTSGGPGSRGRAVARAVSSSPRPAVNQVPGINNRLRRAGWCRRLTLLSPGTSGAPKRDC